MLAAPDPGVAERHQDNKEFLSMVKGDLDLFSDSVYCFTPSGDVKTSAKRFYNH